MTPALKNVIEKYNYKLPSISEQRARDYIKDICKLAKIDKDIIDINYRGNVLKEERKPKYLKIAFHTARRSFATNAVKAGTSISFVSIVLGHKKLQQTFDYLHMTAADFDNMAKESKFFESMGKLS